MKRHRSSADTLRMGAQVCARAFQPDMLVTHHPIQHDLVQRQAALPSARRSPLLPLRTC